MLEQANGRVTAHWDSVAPLLRESPNFRDLDEATLRELAAVLTIKHFEKGQFVFMDGEPVHSYDIVLEGSVRLFKQSPCGKAFTIALLHRGETVNDITVFSRAPFFLHAQAAEASAVASIEKTRFLAIVARTPLLMGRIMETVGRRVKSIIDRTMFLLADSAERRVCKVILMLVGQYGTLLALTHQEIADLAGVTRETVTRTVCHIQALGLVRSSRSNILILDERGLRQVCCD